MCSSDLIILMRNASTAGTCLALFCSPCRLLSRSTSVDSAAFSLPSLCRSLAASYPFPPFPSPSPRDGTELGWLASDGAGGSDVCGWGVQQPSRESGIEGSQITQCAAVACRRPSKSSRPRVSRFAGCGESRNGSFFLDGDSAPHLLLKIARPWQPEIATILPSQRPHALVAETIN